MGSHLFSEARLGQLHCFTRDFRPIILLGIEAHRQFMDIATLRDKTVLAEFRLGRRWHFRSVGTIRVHAPDDSGRTAVDLVMPTAYPKPGSELRVIPLTDEQIARLRPSDIKTHDFIYDGVLFLNDDESEDTKACARPPKIVT